MALYPLGHAFRVECFTYDAEHHCVECAVKRFGAAALAPEARTTDSEGNDVRPCYSFEERPDYARCCASCGEAIDDEPEPDDDD